MSIEAPKPLLEVRNLDVTLKKRNTFFKVLDDLSFHVYPGEILGLVGESGAGKSMTGSAILGLIEKPLFISKGEIIFNGQRIENNAISVRGSLISMVFQDPLISLNPLRRIGEQLVETIRTHINLDKTQAITYAKNLLEEVGIDKHRFRDYPHTFSGGMRQRVVIALALAPRPSLIIADEPTTALDVSVQAQILALLKRLCKERGTSIILITHDMGVIAETADRVGVLYSGRLAEIGSTFEVLSNPVHPYTQGLIAATPRIDPETLDKKLYQIPGTMPNLSEIPNGCPFHKRCPKTTPKCFQVKPPLLYDRASCWLLENKTGVI